MKSICDNTHTCQKCKKEGEKHCILQQGFNSQDFRSGSPQIRGMGEGSKGVPLPFAGKKIIILTLLRCKMVQNFTFLTPASMTLTLKLL